jgi:hypothetical protein
MSKKDIEYEDAYVLEEGQMMTGYEEVINIDLNDDLTLGESLNLEDTYDNLTEDFSKLKVASEVSKKKIEDRNAKVVAFQPKVIKREEIVEDYVRNFLTKYGLTKSLDIFNVSFKNYFRANIANYIKRANLTIITSAQLLMYILKTQSLRKS